MDKEREQPSMTSMPLFNADDDGISVDKEFVTIKTLPCTEDTAVTINAITDELYEPTRSPSVIVGMLVDYLSANRDWLHEPRVRELSDRWEREGRPTATCEFNDVMLDANKIGDLSGLTESELHTFIASHSLLLDLFVFTRTRAEVRQAIESVIYVDADDGH